MRQWDSGQLEEERNQAMLALEPDDIDIGDSTGGGSRRILASYLPPDWRQFQQNAQ